MLPPSDKIRAFDDPSFDLARVRLEPLWHEKRSHLLHVRELAAWLDGEPHRKGCYPSFCPSVLAYLCALAEVLPEEQVTWRLLPLMVEAQGSNRGHVFTVQRDHMLVDWALWQVAPRIHGLIRWYDAPSHFSVRDRQQMQMLLVDFVKDQCSRHLWSSREPGAMRCAVVLAHLSWALRGRDVAHHVAQVLKHTTEWLAEEHIRDESLWDDATSRVRSLLNLG